MTGLTLEDFTDKVTFFGIGRVDWELVMSVFERFVGDNGCSMIFDPLREVSTTM